MRPAMVPQLAGPFDLLRSESCFAAPPHSSSDLTSFRHFVCSTLIHRLPFRTDSYCTAL